MDLEQISALVRAHHPRDETDKAAKEVQLQALGLGGDLSAKHCFEPGHFTASVFVLSADHQRMLLIRHAHFDFWLQPGGHLDGGDTSLFFSAKRELSEELGLVGLEQPGWATGVFDLDVHAIPAGHKGQPAHSHFDVRFVFVCGDQMPVAASDAKDVAWFSLQGMEQENTDESVRRAAHRLILARDEIGHLR